MFLAGIWQAFCPLFLFYAALAYLCVGIYVGFSSVLSLEKKVAVVYY